MRRGQALFLLLIFFLISSPMLTGCIPGEEEEGTIAEGELRNGSFIYSCSGLGDPWCEGYTSNPQTVDLFRQSPDAIALGAELKVTYDALENSEGPISAFVQSGSEAFMKTTSGSILQPLSEGYLLTLAMSADGKVIDFGHLRIEPVDAIIIPNTLESLEQGNSAIVSAQPVSIGREVLGGRTSYVWTSSAPEIIQVESALVGDPKGVNDDTISLVAIAAGSATISVRAFDKEATFEVTVPEVTP